MKIKIKGNDEYVSTTRLQLYDRYGMGFDLCTRASGRLANIVNRELSASSAYEYRENRNLIKEASYILVVGWGASHNM